MVNFQSTILAVFARFAVFKSNLTHQIFLTVDNLFSSRTDFQNLQLLSDKSHKSQYYHFFFLSNHVNILRKNSLIFCV